MIVLLTAVRLVTAFNATPKTILAKQLQFRRLMILKVKGSLLALFFDRLAGKFHLVSKNVTVLLDTFDDFGVGTFQKFNGFVHVLTSLIGSILRAMLLLFFAYLARKHFTSKPVNIGQSYAIF